MDATQAISCSGRSQRGRGSEQYRPQHFTLFGLGDGGAGYRGLAATAQNDGILHITGTSGSNAFAVATVNVEASAQITASASTGAASLPLAISICQTNPQSGQCISAIGPSVTFTINANATPTVAIFATASGRVPFVPQTNRIFVEFSDATEVVRGATIVAVETQ